MEHIITLAGEFELSDALMRALRGKTYPWRRTKESLYAYDYQAKGAPFSISADPLNTLDFEIDLPWTPIVQRSWVIFFLDEERLEEAIHEALECVGRALRATEDDLYVRIQDRDIPLVRYAGQLVLLQTSRNEPYWTAENLAVIPEPYAFRRTPSFDSGEAVTVAGEFELDNALERAAVPDPTQWFRDERWEENTGFRYDHRNGYLVVTGSETHPFRRPAHEIRGTAVCENVSVEFSFEDAPEPRYALDEAFGRAMRIVGSTDGDLVVRYRDLILLARRGGILTLFYNLPEDDFWDRAERTALIPHPYHWEALEPPWHVGRQKRVLPRAAG
ncbi:MAG: hypothetical protein AAFU77_17300 [Myxococcota bacterium]